MTTTTKIKWSATDYRAPKEGAHTRIKGIGDVVIHNFVGFGPDVWFVTAKDLGLVKTQLKAKTLEEAQTDVIRVMRARVDVLTMEAAQFAAILDVLDPGGAS